MLCPGVLLASGRTTLAVFRDELPTTRCGGKWSPQHDPHKVARASGGARTAARLRTPPVPLHAVGAAPERRTRRPAVEEKNNYTYTPSSTYW